MRARKDSQHQEHPVTARRAVLTGGAAGLAAAAGTALCAAQPARAQTVQPSITDWVNVVDEGADPTGGKDSTAAFQNAVAALPTTTTSLGTVVPVGVVYVPAGTYKVSGTIALPANARLVGSGSGSTISGTGSGDVIQQFNLDSPPFPSDVPGGGVQDLVIDGSGAKPGACGLHIGNGTNYHLTRLRISNFTGAGCVGLHLDNPQPPKSAKHDAFTEKMTAEVQLFNNTTNVLIEQTTASSAANSFMYNDFDFHINAQGGQQGVVLQNGAFIANARLKVRGNFYGTGGAALTIAGQDQTNTGNYSYIGRTLIDIAVETDNGASWTTVVFGSANNYVRESSGQLIFTDGWNPATVGSAVTPPGVGVATTTQQFAFAGVVAGDANLSGIVGSPGSPQVNAGAPVVYAANTLDSNNGDLFDNSGDFFKATLTKSITVTLGQGGGSVHGPQRKTIVIVQAAKPPTGGYKVTWPASVKWPGGTVPSMTARANAVDMYELTTVDGVTWFGRASQDLK